jgi:hypothetical protein
MKFTKVKMPDAIVPPADKKYSAKDVLMVRATVEFAVLKTNFSSETVGIQFECAAGDLMYPDKENPSTPWITVETSEVTAKDLKAFIKAGNSQYVYDPIADKDIDLDTLK